MNEEQMKLFNTALECIGKLTDEVAIDKDGKDYSDLWNAYLSLMYMHVKLSESN